MPKISVVVPVYNVEPYLRRCVDSILAQTFKDFELILVDDGSPDECPAICDEYASKDERVVVIHQKNAGLSAARNAGIDWAFANSNSEWITFIDSDDWVHIQYLELLFNSAKKACVEISMCILTVVDSFFNSHTYESLKHKKVVNRHAYNIYENKFYAYSCGKLIKRNILNSIRFPNGKLFEDWHTTYKIIFSTPYISIISNDVYFYFQRKDSITNSNWNISKIDILQALVAHIEYFDHIQQNDLSKIAKKHLLSLTYYHFYECKRYTAINVKKHIRFLRKTMRTSLFRYRKILSITLTSNPEYYECAFPLFMWFYWRYVAIKKSLIL